MSYFYAELNENNICKSVAELAGLSDASYMIQIEEYDLSLLGKRYNDGNWEIIEQEVIESEPSQLDRIEAALSQSQQEMIDREIDRYTLDLIEQGFL